MEIVPNYPTIQNPNCRKFSELKMTGFTNELRLVNLSMCTLREGSTRLSFGLPL
jgi:hypothetical protein